MVGRARELIEKLALAPHPEGGYFREIFRSSAPIEPLDRRGSRAALTVIYFLLAAGQWSRWHRVWSDESWQFCEGDPLELLLFDSTRSEITRARLGTVLEGSGSLHVVPAGRWQAARPIGSYALVTCTVGPGFDFADFGFLRDSPEELRRLEIVAPEFTGLA